jgi:FKBP-type peptidyl-prolyl cis-trans isomerase
VTTRRAFLVLCLAAATGCAKASNPEQATCVIGPELTAQIVASGAGETPKQGETVVVHYVGTLADGTQFDSSRDRDEPICVAAGVGQVIPGWDETLMRMKVGDRWKVVIPWKLAYGEAGRPPIIPGKADLTFDMERLPAPEIKTETLAAGAGPLCANGQRVKVHYVGTLLNGTKFDSSRDRGQPFEFVLGSHGVIPGWEMTVAKMHVGDRVKATIPWLFAYGAVGQPPTIPPKADLVFDIEVLDAK